MMFNRQGKATGSSTGTGTGIAKKQLATIVAIVVAGAIAAFAILNGKPHGAAGGDDEHGHGAAESHAEGAAESHAASEPARGASSAAAGGAHDDTHAHADTDTDTDTDHQETGAKQGAQGGPPAHPSAAADGRVAMSDAQIAAAGVGLDTAAAAPIRSVLQLPGEIRFNEDRTAHVVPRVGGVVESVAASLGQSVGRGQVLAVIASASVSEQRSELRTAQQRAALARTTHERERRLWEQKISPEQDVLQAQQALREAEIAVANATQKLAAIGASASAASLGRYELRAPFDGLVVEKHIALGESVKEDANVFTISDLSTVWAELSVGARDLPQLRVGGRVSVRATASGATAAGTVAYVGALIGEQTRTAKARVVLANPQGTWRPGLFVDVEVLNSEASAAVTVAADAIQTLDEKPAVFVKVPGGFMAQPVQLGRSDGRRIEVLSGLKPGAQVAAAGSFVVKSEQGKGTATHAH